MNNKISEKAVFLVDGSSFLYRAYYGLRPLHTSKGITVQAVYGFCRMIKKLIDAYSVRHIVLVWDSKGQTDRQKIYEHYKATRQSAPSDLFEQKDYIQKFAQLIELEQINMPGAEADDLMYSLAKKFNHDGYQAVIVSSDKDMRQAISDQILLLDPFKDSLMDVVACTERYGFGVEKLPFYFAILGDSSDNIPGVKGIGQKGATELVQQFASLQDLYNNVDKIKKDRMRQLLLEQKENAFLSQQLFLLKTYEVATDVANTVFEEQNWKKALPLFQELEFKSLVADIEKKWGEGVKIESDSESLSLEQKYTFILVNSEQQLIELCQKLQQVGSFALDTETTGLDPMQAQLVGVSVCYQEGVAFYIPFGHQQQGEQRSLFSVSDTQNEQQLSKETVFKHLRPVLEDSKVSKYLHNAKFDQLVLWQAGIYVQEVVFDTMIAASLVVKEWEKKGLKELSKQLFSEDMISYSDVMKKHRGINDFSFIPLKDATCYAAADAHQTFKLFLYFEKELKEKNLENLFYAIEMPISNILVWMQHEGIYCDATILHTLSDTITKDIVELEREMRTLIGRDINLNSPKQVRELLFDELKLAPQGKSDKGLVNSTDAHVLAKLSKDHVVPGMILRYRELFKLKSTYVDALPGYINAMTGKIHSSWNQTLVATGRLSSSDPNLQNIPKDERGDYGSDVRSAFLPMTGWTFVAADYSQIELRILAQFSQDINLIDAFLQNKDIHAQTAAKLFDVDESLVTAEQRSIGKRINFSVLYGLTPYGLSRDMQISFAQAKQYIERYFEQYPGVKLWMDQVVVFTKKNGYTETLFGRRRYVPGIYEKNKTLYELARRIAINTPAQGTAAEITKLGMIAFQKALVEQKLEGKMLLQIHDEIVVSCPDSEVLKISQLLQDCLASVVDFKIPLIVSVKIGKSWREVTK